MTHKMKRLFLMLLTMAPVLAVSFAAKSALAIAQIRNGATDDEVQGGGSPSWR